MSATELYGFYDIQICMTGYCSKMLSIGFADASGFRSDYTLSSKEFLLIQLRPDNCLWSWSSGPYTGAIYKSYRSEYVINFAL